MHTDSKGGTYSTSSWFLRIITTPLHSPVFAPVIISWAWSVIPRRFYRYHKSWLTKKSILKQAKGQVPHKSPQKSEFFERVTGHPSNWDERITAIIGWREKKEEHSLIIARLCVWLQRALITAGTAAPLPRMPSIEWRSRGDGEGSEHTHTCTYQHTCTHQTQWLALPRLIVCSAVSTHFHVLRYFLFKISFMEFFK